MKCRRYLPTLLLLLSISIGGNVAEECADDGCIDKNISDIIERFDKEDTVPLFGGLELVKTAQEDPVTVEKDDRTLLDRIRRYVATHDFVYKGDDEQSPRELSQVAAEGRTGKLKKLMLPLLLALKLKMALVLPVVLTTIALIAIKGVFAGLFAIFLSGATALKSLTESKHEPLTAILATPVHSLHHHHDLKWGRQDQLVQQEMMMPTQLPLEAYNYNNAPYAGYQNVPQAMPMN